MTDPMTAAEQGEASEQTQPGEAAEPTEHPEPSQPTVPVERLAGRAAFTPAATAGVKVDAVLRDAVEPARRELELVAEPGTVGAHLGFAMDAERLGTHYFACTSSAYLGWLWTASVARAPRQKVATVCETQLVAAEGSVLAPEWVPYAERIAPGDLGAGDVLPYSAQDPNLEPGFEATGDEDVDQVALFELGLGRQRVLSALGREVAADRWYAGSNGPTAEVAVKASAHCSTCGYFVPMAGALRAVFGVCASAWSPSDGTVVSLDHGCGAHSEVDTPDRSPVPVSDAVIDEYAVESVRLAPAEPVQD